MTPYLIAIGLVAAVGLLVLFWPSKKPPAPTQFERVRADQRRRRHRPF